MFAMKTESASVEELKSACRAIWKKSAYSDPAGRGSWPPMGSFQLVTIKRVEEGSVIVKIIAVANQKGGVGKTTTSVNLVSRSCCYGESGCCLVDLDPQGNATVSVGLQ